MTLISKSSIAVTSLLCATSASSADYKVKRSLELPIPSTAVWHLIGDFCDIDDWHPNVQACALKAVDGSLVRVLTMDDEREITQKRIAREAGLSYTYTDVNPSMPITRYVATLSIEPGNMSLIEWSANFSSDDPEMEQVVVNNIEAGLASIERMFAVD
jgi:hypothetical protein